ncbi:MAG: putative metalloprotease CJM1_0395 family protein [Alphaproteobacteria bacterium]|jgi:hypothetical protein|nr:putative metalloprotease CJM1_0395 family protein [Alphaproteobacteria bacterium]
MTSSPVQFGGIPRQAFEPGVFARRSARPDAAATPESAAKTEATTRARALEPVEKTQRQGKEAGRPGSSLLSVDALRALQEQAFQERTRAAELNPADVAERYGGGASGAVPTEPGELTAEESRQVAELKRTDQQVRAHEQAHAAAGGQYASAPSYTFETGPDGRKYAVAGEVAIDTSPVPDDPEATIDKMEQVKAAATAPAEPSAQDRQVAAKAEAARIQASIELRRQAAETTDEGERHGTAAASQGINFVDGAPQFRAKPPGDIVNLVI